MGFAFDFNLKLETDFKLIHLSILIEFWLKIAEIHNEKKYANTPK